MFTKSRSGHSSQQLRTKGSRRRERFRMLMQETLEPRLLLAVNGSELRTYRFAVAATEEYTAFHGSRAQAQAEIVSLVDSMNVVLNSELNVHLDLLDRFDLIYGPGNSPDPFSGAGGDPSPALDENQSLLDTVLGVSGYDLGHVFGTFSGGRATLGGAGVDASKGKAASGISSASGPDTQRLLDIVLHEVGHHLNANHSFNGVAGFCVERNAATAYEPGSGTTIMSYAGICPATFAEPPVGDNIQNGPADPYFHAGSLAEIVPHLESLDTAGVGVRTTGTTPPIVDAGLDYSIPAGTPFEITATGSDADGDSLLYTIEQMDTGPAQTVDPFPGDNGMSPLFRSFPPAPAQNGGFTRTFPQISDILTGTTTKGEYLPSVARNLNFRATARDSMGGINMDDMLVTVVAGAPFQVTSPNTAATLMGGSTQNVMWDVAGTSGGTIATSMADIRLSIDGGMTYPFSLAVTENDGMHSLPLPNIDAAAARVKIAGVGNIFFDVSDVDFALAADPTAIGVTVSDDVVVGEAGLYAPATDTYNLSLNTAPGGTVELSVTADDQSEVSVDGVTFASSVTFTRSDTTSQTITVRAKDDSVGEGPHNSTIKHAIVSGTTDYPVGTLINDVVVDVVDNERPPVIGVDLQPDLDPPPDPPFTVPANWTPLTDPFGTGMLMDLIREDGSPTDVDLSITVTNAGSRGGATVTPMPDTVPIHTPSLSGLDGNLRWRNGSNDDSTMPASVNATWSDLMPGQRYAVYVFAMESLSLESINQLVTITGAGIDDPAPFMQVSAGKDDILIVNDDDGDSSRTLESYAKIVTAGTSLLGPFGVINVNVMRDDNVAQNRIHLAGFAIQEVLDAPPVFTKSFAPDQIDVGGTSTLSFTIDNIANAVSDATDLDFTDTLPAGLVIATPANDATTCTGGTLTATAGGSVITYSGGSVAAAASCTVQVDVTSDLAAIYTNISGNLTSSLGNSGLARDTLTVNALPTFDFGDAPNSYLTLDGSAGPKHTIGSTLFLGAAMPDADSDGFGDGTDDTGTALDDDTEGSTPDDEDGVSAFPVLSTASTDYSLDVDLANTTGSNATLVGWIDFDRNGTFEVDEAATATVANNATTATLTWNNIGSAGPDIAVGASFARFRLTSDTIDGSNPGGSASDGEVEDYALTITALPGFVKSFAPNPILVGSTSTLTFTIDNSVNTVGASDLAFIDTLPAQVVIATPSGAATTCGGTLTADAGSSNITLDGGTVSAASTCTVTVDVTSSTADTYSNTSGDLTSSLGNSGPASDTLIVDEVVVFDFGDAPTAVQSGFANDYPTLLSNGARHVIVAGAPFLGAVTPDAEVDGMPDPVALGDDSTDTDDEDAISFAGLTLVAGKTIPSATLSYDGGAAGGLIDGWIDYNRNGIWESPSEQILDDFAIAAGGGSIDLATIPIDVPVGISPGETFARFRIASAAIAGPSGAAADGEVEDHSLTTCGFVVTSTVDTLDPTDDVNTLREAITCANNSPGHDAITFAIPGTGPHTIQVGSSGLGGLPTISDSVTIDGFSQTGSVANTNTVGQGLNTVLQIELDGSQSGNANGLNLAAGNSEIHGLVINRFFDGIHVTSSGNTIAGNFIGTNVDGDMPFANTNDGISIQGSAANTIGGLDPANRNLISGNTFDGVFIEQSGADNNLVQGNLIGTDKTGTTNLGNGDDGVDICNGPTANTVGGTDPAARNVISGNGENGVTIELADANFVIANLIGTDVSGTAALGNTDDNINLLSGDDNHILQNIVSGSGAHGIFVGGNSNATLIQGNWIGSDITGSLDLGNTRSGIVLASDGNIVGGPANDEPNLIVGNGEHGVSLDLADNNVIQSNLIGTNSSGATNLGNDGHGVRIGSAPQNNLFGGTGLGEGNTIANNAMAGVGLQINAAFGNSILGNSIFDNTGLGIDINEDGVTANDLGDTDPGANRLQNFPVLTSAINNGATQIEGSLNSTENATFRIEFFSNSVADPSGFGEGETFLGSTDVTTGVTGDAPISFTSPTLVAAGRFITSTSTLLEGGSTPRETSEFSGSIEVAGATCSLVVTTVDDVVSSVDGVNSLREAINCANSMTGLDTISFDIPGAGVKSIQPSAALPDITDPVIIDGYTQTGAVANTNLVGQGLDTSIMVEIDGTNATSSGIVLRPGSDGSTIRGLAINRFDGVGIFVITAGGHTIEGNFIGTSIDGSTAAGNVGDGISILDSADNTVGGTTPAARNLISANARGVGVFNAPSTGNVIQGNVIGTDAAGASDLGNTFFGIHVFGASDTKIGGTGAGAGNLVSGNDARGINLSRGSSGSVVQGNFVGTQADGTGDLGNAMDGVRVLDSTNNVIGGTAAGAANIIGGNDANGVLIEESTAFANTVLGNFIGTNAAGTNLGNTGNGIAINEASGNTIGGNDAGAGNTIGFNSMNGVFITQSDASGNAVAGNFIGTDVSGTQQLGNTEHGVSLLGSGMNTIGSGPGIDNAANIIAFNGGHGVRNEFVAVASDFKSILGNSIFDNAGLGINLVGGTEDIFGVTANDPLDSDTGSNNLQNYPVLLSAITSATAVVTGTLNSTPDRSFRIEFFSNPTADPSGHGEGKTFLGFQEVTTHNVTGDAAIDFDTGVVVPSGSFISATATDLTTSDTSEFSQVVEVVGTCSLIVDTTADLMNSTDSVNSLREAIICANTTPGLDTIALPTGTYTLTIQGADEDMAATGDLDITDDLLIVGAGAGSTIIDGNELDRVFDAFGITFELRDVTVRNGNVTGGNGGGIRSDQALALRDVVIRDNTASIAAATSVFSGGGGGVDATIFSAFDTQFINNTTDGSGGGLRTSANIFNFARNLFMSNTAAAGGGAIFNGQNIELTDCTFDDNEATTFEGGGFAVEGGNLVVVGCDIVNNRATQSEGGGFANEGGDLTIEDSVVDNNTSSAGGGGFVNAGGNMVMHRVSVTNNTSGQFGGGGFENQGGNLEVRDSTIAANTSGDVGGGFDNEGGDAVISGTTISGNAAGNLGGGFFADGGLTHVANSTISGNSGLGFGGGVQIMSGTTFISVNNTIVENQVLPRFDFAQGGGLFIEATATVTLNNTIVADNFEFDFVPIPTDISGAVSGMSNLIGDGTGMTGLVDGVDGNQVGSSGAAIDPLLGPLQNNGGPTETHALLTGSPAIDAGDDALALDDQGAALTTDQRGMGFPRSDGVAVDIGAFESGLVALPTVAIADAAPVTEGADSVFNITLSRPLMMGEQVVVTYNTVNDTAIAPGDYDAAVDGMLTFNFGDPVTKMIAISTNDDDVPEMDEMFDVNITATGVSGIDRDSASGTIGDTPDFPVATINNVTVTEGADAVFMVTLNHPPVTTATINYSTIEGTAMDPEDYVGDADQLTFAPGVTTQTITITTKDDQVVDSDPMETFSVNLSAPMFAVIGNPGLGTGTILDNDMACSLVVTSTDDTVDSGDGFNSLREAILCANSSPGLDTITFAIPGAGPHMIQPTSALPSITDSVIIDGYSQGSATATTSDDASPNTNPITMASNADIRIVIDGSSAGGGVVGLNLAAGNSTIRGLNIQQFGDDGIQINSSGNTIAGNYIGTDVTGMIDRGNGFSGIRGFVGTNTIGGSNQADRNVISGNEGPGINLFSLNATDTSNNLIVGNLIGLNASGDAAIGNALEGIALGGSPDNRVGGPTLAQRNVISGNGLDGVNVFNSNKSGPGNIVQGNYIGTDVTGTTGIGNLRNGVRADGANGNVGGGVIGGLTDTPGTGVGNLISGNGQHGIAIFNDGATDWTIQGNLVGTNAAGTAAIANQIPTAGHGLQLASEGSVGHTVGGTDPRARNIISGNVSDGIQLEGDDHVVVGNFIGTDISGTVAIPNASDGVDIDGGDDNVIGGSESGAGNVIAGNSGRGVRIRESGNRNTVIGNLIGSDVTGTSILGNGNHGVGIENSEENVVGGTATSAANLIVGNGGHGVFVTGVDSIDNIIVGNSIGTDAGGTSDLGNSGSGVRIEDDASNNTITGNTIAFNSTVTMTTGVSVVSGTGNTISQNSIFQNAGLGIDLGGDGVTRNDSGDADIGPNDLLNFPVIESATVIGTDLVLAGFARPGVDIEFFIADPDPTGFGEGRTYLVTRTEGSIDDDDVSTGTYGPGPVNGFDQGTDTTNRFRFVLPIASLPGTVPLGTLLTATATDADNTSEFSGNVTIEAAPVLRSDLAVTKMVSDSRPNVGDEITFTVTLANDGPDPASGVMVTDLLPSGLNFLGSNQPGTYNGATGIWSVGSLAAGNSVDLLITALVASPGGKTNLARVTAADQLDPVAGNNQASQIVTPQIANVSVLKSADNTSATLGELVEFTIDVRNDGPDVATGVIVSELLPSGLQFIEDDPSTGSYNQSTGVWSVGQLAVGANETLQLMATLTTSQSVTNTARIESDQFDPVPVNNVSTVEVGACLTSEPLVPGTNRLFYSCVTPGGFASFVVGSQLGSHYFDRWDVTVDIDDPSVPVIGIANINGVAEVLVDLTAAQLDQPLFFQAFEMVPNNQNISNILSNASSFNSLDANRDGNVSAIDALVIINHLSRVHAEGESVAGTLGQGHDYDTNRDGKVSAIDALKVVNHLASRSGTGELVSEADRALPILVPVAPPDFGSIDDDLLQLLADDSVRSKLT